MNVVFDPHKDTHTHTDEIPRILNNVCATEEKSIPYLRDMGVLSTEMMCPSEGCGTLVESDLTRCRWRCFKKNCPKTLQIRGENRFFYYTESSGRRHSRLKLNEILEMLYLFLFTRMTIREAVYTTGHY